MVAEMEASADLVLKSESIYIDTVSYTHLDVYKRQEYSSQEAKIKTLVAAINDENLSN